MKIKILREAIIQLDDYELNREPYDLEIEEYISTLNENKYEDSIEELNHKLKKHLELVT